MKRTLKFLLFTMVFLSGVVVMSCERKVRGCTDPDSITFDELAEKDDGNCLYEGRAVIWYNEAASAGLEADGATALTFYVGGDVVGSSATSVFWPNEPFCGDDGSITVTEDLGHSRRRTFELSVVDQDGFEYWNVDLEFQANTCLIMELAWDKRKKK